MANYNKVLLMGNLTRDPEVRYTPKGAAITKLGLAVNRRYTIESTGEQREETTFVDVDAFGKQAEVIAQYFRKGKPIFVEGRLKFDQWEDKNTGAKMSKLRVVLEGFQFINGSRGEAGGGSDSGESYSAPQHSPPSPPPQRPAPNRPQPPAHSSSAPGEEDDVPF